MAESVGIQETKEVAVALAQLGCAIAKNVKDGEFEFIDYASFIGSLPAAIDNIEEVPAELKDLSGPEAEEVLNAVVDAMEPFGVVNIEIAKAWVTVGISVIETIIATVNAINVTQG